MYEELDSFNKWNDEVNEANLKILQLGEALETLKMMYGLITCRWPEIVGKIADLRNEGPVNLLQDVVHLHQLGLDERTVRSADVADVVEAEVVKDQNVPVVSLQSAVQMPCHVVVNLRGEWGVKNKKVNIYWCTRVHLITNYSCCSLISLQEANRN